MEGLLGQLGPLESLSPLISVPSLSHRPLNPRAQQTWSSLCLKINVPKEERARQRLLSFLLGHKGSPTPLHRTPLCTQKLCPEIHTGRGVFLQESQCPKTLSWGF